MSYTVDYITFAFYQQTWYEKWFGAYLEDPIIRRRYHFIQEEFKTGKISSKNLTQILETNKVDKGTQDILLPIYDQSKTAKEFFDTLRTSIKTSQLYAIVRPWLNDFMIKFGLNFIMVHTWIDGMSLQPLGNYKYKFIGSGPVRNTKKLSIAEKKSLRMQNWIGWKYIGDLADYSQEDQNYIRELQGLTKK